MTHQTPRDVLQTAHYHIHTCIAPIRDSTSSLPWGVLEGRWARSALAAVGLLAVMGAPAQAQETQAQSVAKSARQSTDVRAERFDDWTLRCVMPPKRGNEAAVTPACEIAQPLMVSQDGKPAEILNLAVSRANDKARKADWALVVLTPLDVQLSSDFGFVAGAAKPSLLRYRNCNHLGCFVIVPLDRDRIAQMKKAADGATFFRLLTGQAVKVSFSLRGFTKAFDALASGTIPAATSQANGASPVYSDGEGASN